MATTPDITRRTQITLDTTAIMLDELPYWAADWETRSEDERVDIFLDWEGMMQRFSALTDPRYAAEVNSQQQGRLRALAQRLLEARDVILRLGLDYPDLGRLSRAS